MDTSLLDSTKQILLIVFSVVLGLFLSQRIEERKDETEANQLLSRILSEVNDNKMLIKEWAPYHREIANNLVRLNNDEEFIESFIKNKRVIGTEILTKGTFMGRMPSADAWDIAKSHPLIVNLDYDIILMLSKIYNQQKSTFSPTDKISEVFLSPDFNSKEKAQINLQTLTMNMQEIVSREQQLIEFFDESESIFTDQSLAE